MYSLIFFFYIKKVKTVKNCFLGNQLALILNTHLQKMQIKIIHFLIHSSHSFNKQLKIYHTTQHTVKNLSHNTVNARPARNTTMKEFFSLLKIQLPVNDKFNLKPSEDMFLCSYSSQMFVFIEVSNNIIRHYSQIQLICIFLWDKYF